MDASFWHKKWADNNIAFHNSEVHPLLVKHFGVLFSEKDSGESSPREPRVFVPLCGKTLDIGWLLSKGYRVVGAELSNVAIDQLFAELGTQPNIVKQGEITQYSAANIDIFVGDIFDVSCEMLGAVDAVYDRAALVALPKEMRDRYTTHLLEITNKAPQLLICFVYDQTIMAGPPHSISNQEVYQHYGDSYVLTLAESEEMPDGLKGKCPATKNVWILKNG